MIIINFAYYLFIWRVLVLRGVCRAAEPDIVLLLGYQLCPLAILNKIVYMWEPIV